MFSDKSAEKDSSVAAKPKKYAGGGPDSDFFYVLSDGKYMPATEQNLNEVARNENGTLKP
jgi:hypothetical protein